MDRSETAQMRRLYLHMKSGGKLRVEDMERIIEWMEYLDKRVIDLKNALIDLTEGESSHDLRYNTGLDIHRCEEILKISQS